MMADYRAYIVGEDGHFLDLRRACSRRGKSPAGDSLRRLDGVWNAWSDCHRRCAGRCIGDEARILPTFAHRSHARSERAVTAFLCATHSASCPTLWRIDPDQGYRASLKRTVSPSITWIWPRCGFGNDWRSLAKRTKQTTSMP
jgi:hypothetical protein